MLGFSSATNRRLRLLSLLAGGWAARAQGIDPTPKPRPTLPHETPPAALAEPSQPPPPIFAPSFSGLLTSHSYTADPNLVLMAPFVVKDHGPPAPISPLPFSTPLNQFIATGVIEENVGKKVTTQWVLPFSGILGYRILW